jgi:hypothetical protein
LNLKKLYIDICLGFSRAKINNDPVFIKHLSPLETAEVDEIYEDSLDRARRSGLLSRDEKLEQAIQNGLWSKAKEKSIESYQSDISRLMHARNKLDSKAHLKSLNEEISLLEKLWEDLLREKFNITNGCAEDFADNLSNQYQIFISVYQDKELIHRKFSNDDFEYLDQKEYLDILIICKNTLENLNINTIRKISCSSFFLDPFSLVNDPFNFFLKPIYSLTFYQTKLLKYGAHFKNILTECGSPDNNVFGDPDKFEEWYYIKKSGKENEEQEVKKNEDKWRSLANTV